MTTPLRIEKRLVYLTGFMGSGKSTIGPILANTLGFRFIDVDRLIEEKTGKSVSSIFKDDGEPLFRQHESEALDEIRSMQDAVVSLGGGTVASEENFRLVHASGILIYLQLSPEDALRRMRRKLDRPMLRDDQGLPLTGEPLEERIRDLLEVREQFYRRADIIVATGDISVGSTVDDIVRRLRTLMTI